MRVFVLICCVLAPACGGATAPDGDTVGRAAPTFVMDERSCTKGAKPTADEATAKLEPSDLLAVVEVLFIDECSGAGGHWIIARELDSSRRFFLGAHACQLWTTPPLGKYGVVRFRQTAGLRSTPEGWCVAFPGEASVQTDQATSGIVVFETRGAAEAFASERGWKRP